MPGKYWSDPLNVVRGCTPCGPECDHCYAAREAMGIIRKGGTGADRYRSLVAVDGHWSGALDIDLALIDRPRKWRQPRVIFVCNMSDLFHAAVPRTVIDRTLQAAFDTDRHVWLFLTKRTEIMRAAVNRFLYSHGLRMMPEHMWFGFTAGSDAMLCARGEAFKGVRAARKYVSIEPMLSYFSRPALTEYCARLDLAIIGDESGPDPRAGTYLDYSILRGRLANLGVPTWTKQWSSGGDITPDPISELPWASILRARRPTETPDA